MLILSALRGVPFVVPWSPMLVVVSLKELEALEYTNVLYFWISYRLREILGHLPVINLDLLLYLQLFIPYIH